MTGDGGSGPTEREGGGSWSVPTVREGDGSGSVPTVREGHRQGQGADGGSVPTSREQPAGASSGWVPVPLSLQHRYRYVGQVASSGGEANLYRVHPVNDPDRALLLKLYLGSVQLDADALEAIRSMDPRHVVAVVDHGTVAETGHWFEVQEYLDHGDLLALLDSHSVRRGRGRALHPRMVRAIVGQLHDALRAFHRTVGPHHDVKPSNVLVRTPPPDLHVVLADFGLAVASDRSVIYQSRRAGTIAYDSPESLGAGQGGRGRDWWALGMTVAHLAGGRHHFEHPTTGAMLTDAAIRDHLHNRRPIDLDAVTDPDLNILCQGLTRYDPTQRWGSAQLTAWQQGHTVPVASEQPAAIPLAHPAADVPGVDVTGVDFTGRRFTNRQALAHALADDWRAAAVELGRVSARQAFVDRVVAAFGGRGLEDLDADWARQTTSPGRAVADLIVALDPTIAPVVNGWDVSVPGLAGLVRAALADDEHSRSARRTIDSLFSNQLLDVFGQLDGHRELRELDRRWRQATQDLDDLLERAGSNGVRVDCDQTDARAILLGACADGAFLEGLTARYDQALRDRPEATRHPSVAPIRAASEPTAAQLLGVVLLAPQAALVVREQRERQREQDARQERERRDREREADRARLSEAIRAGQDSAAARIVRIRNVVVDIALVVAGAVVVFFPAAVLGAFGSPQVIGPVRENISTLQPIFLVAAGLTAVAATIANLRMPANGRTVRRALHGWEFVPALQFGIFFVIFLPLTIVVGLVRVNFSLTSSGAILSPLDLLIPAVVPAVYLLGRSLLGDQSAGYEGGPEEMRIPIVGPVVRDPTIALGWFTLVSVVVLFIRM